MNLAKDREDWRRGHGRPKKAKKKAITEDLRTFGLSMNLAEDKEEWRSGHGRPIKARKKAKTEHL